MKKYPALVSLRRLYIQIGTLRNQDAALVSHLERARKHGFDVRLISAGNSSSQTEIENKIDQLCEDYKIDGILLQVIYSITYLPT